MKYLIIILIAASCSGSKGLPCPCMHCEKEPVKESPNWVREWMFEQVVDEPVIEPHICIDSTHNACDGVCVCDGIECLE